MTNRSDRWAQRAAVSYITGSHSFKTGIQAEEGQNDIGSAVGISIVAALLVKIVPRESVAKYRVPEAPSVTGSAFAKYELAGSFAEALQVAAPVPTSVTPAAAFFASVRV